MRMSQVPDYYCTTLVNARYLVPGFLFLVIVILVVSSIMFTLALLP